MIKYAKGFSINLVKSDYGIQIAKNCSSIKPYNNVLLNNIINRNPSKTLAETRKGEIV